MALTDTEIRKYKATGKEYQKADSRGLVLVVRAAGGKFWRYEYRLDGKKFRYGLGNYPEISLSDARKIHTIARQLVEFGKHPSTLLDNPGAKQAIIDGDSVKEIESQAVIMRVLDAEMPSGYAIAKLNNVKSFLMIYLLLDKWAGNRHLLPMTNGVLDTNTMQLTPYSRQHCFNWQLPCLRR